MVWSSTKITKDITSISIKRFDWSCFNFQILYVTGTVAIKSRVQRAIHFYWMVVSLNLEQWTEFWTMDANGGGVAKLQPPSIRALRRRNRIIIPVSTSEFFRDQNLNDAVRNIARWNRKTWIWDDSWRNITKRISVSTHDSNEIPTAIYPCFRGRVTRRDKWEYCPTYE
jgi:hypothetical protein